MSFLKTVMNSQYYAKPEGEDFAGKMFATNRIAIQAALGVAVTDIVMVSHPKGYLPTISRLMWWLGPAAGMASAFTAGTYMSTNLRGKDDKLNYIVGSCAAAGVCGAWQRNPVLGFSMCLFFSIAGCAKKVSLEEGWEFFPNMNLDRHQWGGLKVKRNDFTLTPEGEKGWTTGKE